MTHPARIRRMADEDNLYVLQLAETLIPQYGEDKALRLARAFDRFSSNTPRRGLAGPLIEEHNREARARFNAEVRAIKNDT